MKYILEKLEGRRLLAAQLLADLNPTTPSSNPGNFTTLNASTTLFWANGQLYATDGTSQNTVLLKSGLNQGTGVPMFVIGGFAYFRAFASSSVLNLWRTDGTSSGTQIVTQLSSTSGALSLCNDRLYFGDSISSHGQLWTSDGTAAGTQLVHQFAASDPPVSMTYYNSYVYFTANDAGGRELWRTDGTDANTTRVKDINTAGDSTPSNLRVSNGLLYFSAATSSAGNEPWRTDGTPAGTIALGDIVAGSAGSSSQGFVDIGGGTTLFTAAGFIYKTSGTGFTKVYGGTGDPGSSFSGLVGVGSLAFCVGSTTANGQHLWRTDGTHAGTFPAEALSSASTSPTQLTRLNSDLYFVASNAIYRTDGVSTASVKLVIGMRPFFFTAIGNSLMFSADDPTYGREAFISDGTGAGTSMLADLNATPNSSAPTFAMSIGDSYFAVATTATSTRWARSDGNTVVTPVGSSVPSSFNGFYTYSTNWNGSGYYFGPGSTGFYRLDSDGSGSLLLSDVKSTRSDPIFTPFKGKLYFAAATVNNPTVYFTDGTPGNTQRLNPSLEFFGSMHGMTAGDSYLYFAGKPGFPTSVSTLYRSDGISGSTALPNQRPSSTGAYNGMTWFHGKLYFFWSDIVNNSEVVQMYSTDGESPPLLIKQFPGSFGIPQPIILNDRMYFSASSLSNALATKLWMSDGTTDGTIETSVGFSSFVGTVGNRLFFTVPTAVFNRTLWVTDGTSAGTFRLCNADVSAIESMTPGNWSGGTFAVANGNIFFNADDGVHGKELWRTDGTIAGTQLVADLVPGSGGVDPGALGHAGSTVIFAATDAVHGRELWKQTDEFPPAVWEGFAVKDVNLALSIRFNESVDPVRLMAGLSVVNLGTNAKLDLSEWTQTYDTVGNVFRLLAPDTAQLTEGNFELHLNGDDIRDTLGNFDSSDLTISFFNLPGDANVDRHVNTLDFTDLVQNFNKSSATFGDGDFNYDGQINALDFNILASKFGTYLAPPSGAQALERAGAALPKSSLVADLFGDNRIANALESDVLI